MIVGVGTDLVEVARIRAFRARRGARGLRRLFDDHEVDYCLSLERPAPSLAARFAAKEAFFKALGTGCGRAGRWTDIGVRRDEDGAPRLAVRARAADTARRRGVRRFHLSLAHTAGHATAIVLFED